MSTKASSTPPAKKTVGIHVELASGDRVLVRPWGFDHIGDNSGILFDIGADVMRAWDRATVERVAEGGDRDDEGAQSAASEAADALIRQTIVRNVKRFRGLLAASMEGGDADVDKLQGILDLVNVIDAMLETNGILEAVEKVQARTRAITERQKKMRSRT